LRDVPRGTPGRVSFRGSRFRRFHTKAALIAAPLESQGLCHPVAEVSPTCRPPRDRYS
jgi:hypothetical protein